VKRRRPGWATRLIRNRFLPGDEKPRFGGVFLYAKQEHRGFSLDWPDLKTAIFHPCNLRQSTQRGIEGSKKQVLTGKSFAKGAYLHSLG
jgi:hypothetical protein